MGDVVGATTFIDDIRAAYPAAEIHLNTLQPWDRLFEGDARFARVFTVDVRGRKGRFAAALQWIRAVLGGRYDLIFDLQSTDRSRIMLGLVRLLSPRLQAIVGHNPGYPYPHAPQRPAELYPGWHSDLALRAAGIPRAAQHGHLHVSPESRERVAALMARHGLRGGHYVLLLPGSQKAGWLKRWGVGRYAGLARALREAGVEKVAIIGGPEVFGLFMDAYDTFWLSQAHRVTLRDQHRRDPTLDEGRDHRDHVGIRYDGCRHRDRASHLRFVDRSHLDRDRAAHFLRKHQHRRLRRRCRLRPRRVLRAHSRTRLLERALLNAPS